MQDAIFVIIAGLVSIILLVMRTNMALAILGLCAGYVFSDIFSDRLSGFLYNNNYSTGSLPVASVVSIALIIFPALMIILRFRHYQKNRAIQHIIPIFAFIGLLAVLVLNNLPLQYEADLINSSIIFSALNRHELLIIAGVITLSVLDIMIFEFERERHIKKLKRRGKKRHKS